MTRSRLTILLTCAALAALVVAAFAATTRVYPGQTTLNLEPLRINGVLSSPNAACERNRRITVYVINGSHVNTAGFDTTNANGRWRTSTAFIDQDAKYRATTPAKMLARRNGVIRKCARVTKVRDFGN